MISGDSRKFRETWQVCIGNIWRNMCVMYISYEVIMIFLELNCAMKYQCKFWAGIKLKIVYWISVKKHVYLTNCSGNKICSTLQPPAFRSCLIIGQIN